MIEERYYERVNEHSTLKEALKDPTFLAAPSKHVALYSDHGVVHARDVAQEILKVLDSVHGVLIPRRDPERFAWMQAYGVIVSFVHDIGMVDLSAFGRFMHAERATQTILDPEFDDILEPLWTEDRAGISERLTRLVETGHLNQDARTVFREMLAMAVCHSKTKVAIGFLNDLPRLRANIQTAATTDLRYLYLHQQVERAQRALQEAERSRAGVDEHAERLNEAEAALAQAGDADRRSPFALAQPRPPYEDFEREGFSWLESDQMPGMELVEDVVDTLRALRSADALRQRGTVLKTSGNYEVFVDQRSANAIYALRFDDEHLYLLEIPDAISAGEANIASSEVDKDGNLRVSFFRGSFSDHETVLYAARSAAYVVNDIQADTIESFQRPESDVDDDLRRSSDIEILIEAIDDNPAFADLVCLALLRLNPAAAAQTRVVPSLQANSAIERAHYLKGADLDWDRDRRVALLKKLEAFGHRTGDVDPIKGFIDVRRIRLGAGETLIEAGAPAGFVYIPEGDGLRIVPLGGYDDFYIRPWIPVGVTGVIRGSVRNADVVADQDLTLLTIPRDVYLKYWHHTYDQTAFAELFSD
jgi:hypothetical protein